MMNASARCFTSRSNRAANRYSPLGHSVELLGPNLAAAHSPFVIHDTNPFLFCQGGSRTRELERRRGRQRLSRCAGPIETRMDYGR